MSEKPEQPQFYVVGIGASAGGLQAIEQFLRHTPNDANLSFVIIQHLDPDRESGLVDLMRGWTTMPVVQIKDGMPVEPNQVYVIPPNHTLALMHGVLQLMQPPEPHYRWRPIDYFLRSLADDQGERAIGVILSGAGTDGALGLKAIKGAGGLTIVQTPETASFPSMPNSGIATDLVDLVLSPADIPSEILDYIDHAHVLRKNQVVTKPDDSDQSWRKIFFLLRSHTGHDFSQYKQTTIRRRVERRMLVNRVDDLNHYVRYLQQQSEELDILFRELLIGVTQFFRDANLFEALANKAIRPLIERKISGEPLRIWVNGCSTGEEAYSIAILIHEQMEIQGRQLKMQIFATDIDDNAITLARRGIYDAGITVDVGPDRLHRYFEQENNHYRVKPVIRDDIVFATHNTFQDPPFSNVDLISCRNLLIYLGPELQEKVIPILHYALVPEGYLFLGSSETLGQFSRLFTTIDAQARLFQRREVPSAQPDFTLRSPLTRNYELNTSHRRIDMNQTSGGFRQLAEKTLLENYTPPAVIVNDGGDIVYVHGRTGKYLEPAEGEATLNLQQMGREGLRLLLTNMVRKAAQQQEELIERRVQVKTNEHFEIIDLIVRPLHHPEYNNLLLVVFEATLPLPGPDELSERDDIAGADNASRQRIVELERELQNTREHLQTTVENLEASNEELKSTNEELQSANEELQSANEELTSAKEELQSVNEELLTVNSELENKIDELSRANDDLNNLLTSVDIGIIFLDEDLHIVRFNQAATNFLNLMEEDVGRAISDLMSKLEYSGLVNDARAVLNTLESKETEVRMGSGWYMLRIRPYRTSDNIINGVIITFAEITEQKRVEQNLRKLSRAVDQSTDIILIMDVDGTIDYANQRAFEVTGYTGAQIIGQPFHNLLVDDDDTAILDQIVTTHERWSGELQHQTAAGVYFWVEALISPIMDEQGQITHLFAVEEDITQRKHIKQTVEDRWDSQGDADMPHLAVLVFDHNLQYILGDAKALREMGLDEADLEGTSADARMSSELEHYYRAAVRGDNIYFERQSGGRLFGVQVMPVRDGTGQIMAGVVIVWRIDNQEDNDE